MPEPGDTLTPEMEQENAAHIVVFAVCFFAYCLWSLLVFFEVNEIVSGVLVFAFMVAAFLIQVRRWNKQIEAQEEKERLEMEAKKKQKKDAGGKDAPKEETKAAQKETKKDK